jgi:hypothetical protein
MGTPRIYECFEYYIYYEYFQVYPSAKLDAQDTVKWPIDITN